jgi:hypothetical protein
MNDDNMKMSKHVAVYIIYCCDIYIYIYIYVYDTNCAFVGYNKNNKIWTVHVLK